MCTRIRFHGMLLFTCAVFWIMPPPCTCINPRTVTSSIDERCRKTKIFIASNRINDSCKFFESTDDRPVKCKIDEQVGDDATKLAARCEAAQCCWLPQNMSDVESGCYKKPTRCYIDLRPEMCPILKGVDLNQIFEGYSLNGSHCFVENVQPYFTNKYEELGNAVSSHGFRIVDENNPPCCRWIRTNVRETVNYKCKVEFPGSIYDPLNGTIWAGKCVVNISNLFTLYDLDSNKACVCHLNAWLEDNQESLIVSPGIRKFVEKEENQNRCTQILGRLVRSSWKNRLDIVNSAEANVVMNALLNITDGEVDDINAYDAGVLLDTSEQLTKYRFYEGIENDSAKHLIKSSAKVMSNLIKHVIKAGQVKDGATRVRRGAPTEPNSASEDNSTSLETSNDLQWKIMSQLESIAENVASQIRIPEDDQKYVVVAAETAVHLQLTIARPADAFALVNLSHSEQGKPKNQDAYVTDFSAYKNATSDENVAVITVFYSAEEFPIELPKNSSARSGSDILAINLRRLTHGYVKGNLSLPVRFTMSWSTFPCVGANTGTKCNEKPECVFAEPNSEGRAWSNKGCMTEQSDENNTTTCSCNHTTHFAVLMQTVPTISKADTKALEFLSVSLGSISAAALAATAAVFIAYRKILLKDRMLIHMHLIVALMCGYIFFLCGSIFSKYHLNIPAGCFFAAIASHFFFLSTFFWFFVEGIYLFQKVILVFSSKWAERVAKYSPLIGWLCPVIVVGVSVATSRTLPVVGDGEDAYYDINTCFLQSKNHMIWAFMGPVVLIVMVNCFILTRVLLVIYRSTLSSAKKAKTTEQEQHSASLKNSAKGAVILLPILGIPWIVNMFVNVNAPSSSGYNFAATLGAYIHVILMGLQGVAVFVFYCVFNTEVRNAYKLNAARRKSLASIETATKRKRSRAPLLASKNSSPDLGKYRTTDVHTNRTYKTTELSLHDTSEPPSPEKNTALPIQKAC